jgi:predicted dehydrogenase
VSTEPKILRLAFVGLGQAVNRMFQHSREIATLPYRITAAAEKRPHALAAFRRDFGGETYDSVEELCRSPNVDVVYVATGPELHCEHVVTAAQHGKHIVVEKPMAMRLDECEKMIEAADRNGVKLLAGHTHSFDAPIRRMHEIVKSGRLGKLVMVNTWNYNAFNPRPWPTVELQTTHGPVLNQGPHQIDIIRQIGGGMLRSVRATTFWDTTRRCEGGYNCFVEFENGVTGSVIYDARGFFDTAELSGWVAEGGGPRDENTNFRLLKSFHELRSQGDDAMERIIEERKEYGRYGAQNIDPQLWKFFGYSSGDDIIYQPYFGFTLVSCERGAMRQSPHGILIYDEKEKSEITIERELRGRGAELMDLYNAIVRGAPLFHDGRWGMATLEACLAIVESAKARKEIVLRHQVPMPG